MKIGGIIVAFIGAALFLWHITKILVGTDYGSPPLTHHWMSLIGGMLMFAGIWLYVAGRKRRI